MITTGRGILPENSSHVHALDRFMVKTGQIYSKILKEDLKMLSQGRFSLISASCLRQVRLYANLVRNPSRASILGYSMGIAC